MIDNTKEYILCAAIKRNVPRIGQPYWEGTNDIMDIEIGYRHHDIFYRFEDGEELNGIEQGFYTSEGRYVDRIEAMKIAFECGQVSAELALTNGKYNKLFSEDLY